jgi:hypothetical protein
MEDQQKPTTAPNKKLLFLGITFFTILSIIAFFFFGLFLFSELKNPKYNSGYHNTVKRVFVDGEDISVLDTNSAFLKDPVFIGNVAYIRNQLSEGGYTVVNDYSIADIGNDNCTLILNPSLFVSSSKTRFCVVEVCKLNIPSDCLYVYAEKNRYEHVNYFELIRTQEDINVKINLLLEDS